MGVYDEVRVEYPLPNPAHNAHVFQTKDLPQPYLRSYRVTAEGVLEEELFRREQDGSDWTTRRRVPIGWQPVLGFSGKVSVCDFADAVTRTGWVEYDLTFENGRLQRVELFEDTPPGQFGGRR